MQTLYRDIRKFVLAINPDANELLYFSHALTSVYSPSKQLKHAYCHIAIYSRHINLGFNQGALLPDPAGLLKGSGRAIRHVSIAAAEDLGEPALSALVEAAVAHSLGVLGHEPVERKAVVSKIP